MKLIIDNKYIDVAKKQWGTQCKIFPSFSCENLQAPVNAHPDMTLTQIGDVFVCCPEGFEYYKAFLKDRLICGKTRLFPNYPFDVAYNVLIYEKFAFGKADAVDRVVKKELEKRNIKLINVNQGYAKCSTAVCKEGIITADKTIYSACVDCGINSLKITPGHVRLTGYDYGFIGGASGKIGDKLVFFGDIEGHPDYEKIKSFCDFDYIRDFILTDVGTIMCI